MWINFDQRINKTFGKKFEQMEEQITIIEYFNS